MVQDAEEQKRKLETFRNDTMKLGDYTADFINHFYPSYGVNNELVIQEENV